MPRIPSSSGLNTVRLQDLQGTKIASGEEKVAETTSSRIEFSSRLQGDFFLPEIKIEARTIDDPQKKENIIALDSNDVASISTGEDFIKLLDQLKEEHKGFMLPDRTELADALGGDDSHFAFNNISGKRIEQFYGEAMELLEKTDLHGPEMKAARRAINLSHADAYRGRDIKFDKSDTVSYWSYSKDAPYVHVYEKMLDALPEGDPQREAVQNHIDFIFSRKYAYTGKVDENNAEKTMGLVAIDKNSRNVVSIDPNTINSPQVRYQTIKVSDNGGEHDGKQVVWDNKADKYFFQGTTTEVPAELHSSFRRTPANNVTFRRAGEDESLRDGFKFDWNRNRMVDAEKIDASWWGHCDTRAVMETIHTDMKGSAGVMEYRSDSGAQTDYKRSDLLEIMASQLNMGGGYTVHGTNETVSLGETKFGGARYDERPDTAYMNVNGQWQNFNIHIDKMSEPGEPDKAADVDNIFDEFKMGEDGRSFEKNEDLMQVISGDTNIVDGNDRTIEGSAEYYTVSESGQWVETKEPIKIDPNSDEPIIIGTQIQSIGSRSLTRTYYNPKTGELSQANVSFKKDADGKFVAEEGNKRNVGYSRSLLLAREMPDGDDVAGKAALTDGAIRTGNSIAADSSKNSEVWNGAVTNLKERVVWRSDDGKFEKIEIRSDARYGSGKVGTKINELNDEGEIVNTFEVDAPVDFFWRDVPRVAPIVHENGRWHINNGMTERGMLDLNKLDASLETFHNLNDLLYLGLSTKDNKKVYTIVHEGQRLVYDTKEAWEADVKKLEEAAGRGQVNP